MAGFGLYTIKNLRCRRVLQIFSLVAALLIAAFVLHLYFGKKQDTYSLFRPKPNRPFDSSATSTSLDLDPQPPLFAVNTDRCKLPLLDPFHRQIKRFLGYSVSYDCTRYPPLFTSFSNNKLRINREILKKSYNTSHVECTFEVIRRPNDTAVLFDLPKTFSKDVGVEAEFVRVSCPFKSGNTSYRFYHTNVPRKRETEQRLKEVLMSRTSPGHYNILMLGIDSMSRSNVVRQMPQTRNYLLRHLNTYEMLGYNKVEDNTLPNIVALLTGQALKDAIQGKLGRKHHFDDFPFIWKQYAQNGYRTLFAEDDPKHGMFNHLQSGFREKPTDYYYRPFAMALEGERSLWWKRDCVGPETEVSLVLDYVKKFVLEFKKDRFFAFTFLSRLTHDNPNRAHAIDKLVKGFLVELKEKRVLENTIVVLLSDHGARYGPLRSTSIGSAEERLPMSFLSFPEKFLHDHPNYRNNLKINQHRLTTPYDIHHTLKALLSLDESNIVTGTSSNTVHKKPSRSLLHEVPTSRDCSSADISPHWCMCRSVEVLSPDLPIAQKGARHAVFHMNNLLTPYPELCNDLTLDTIEKAHFIRAGVLRQSSGIKTYMLTFTTGPGRARFEATLGYDVNTKTFDIIGMISRIDSYNTKSHCINDPSLRLYCDCKIRS